MKIDYFLDCSGSALNVHVADGKCENDKSCQSSIVLHCADIIS